MLFKVSTYNIAAGLSNGYFKKKNYYKSAEVIKNIGADVITLNEVGKPLPAFIKEHTEFLAKYCGYKYYAFAKATSFGAFPYGNAILSKYPIKNVEVTPMKKFFHIALGIYEPRCILTAEVEGKKKLRVMCSHFGLLPDEQKLGIENVISQINKSDIPTIFMGDLNINGATKKRLTPLRNVLHDVCETKKTKLNTFPAKKPKKRLDYIFISDNIDVEDVYTVRAVASDHLPLVAEIVV